MRAGGLDTAANARFVQALAVADVDGDGLDDLLAASPGTHEVWVCWGDPTRPPDLRREDRSGPWYHREMSRLVLVSLLAACAGAPSRGASRDWAYSDCRVDSVASSCDEKMLALAERAARERRAADGLRMLHRSTRDEGEERWCTFDYLEGSEFDYDDRPPDRSWIERLLTDPQYADRARATYVELCDQWVGQREAATPSHAELLARLGAVRGAEDAIAVLLLAHDVSIRTGVGPLSASLAERVRVATAPHVEALAAARRADAPDAERAISVYRRLVGDDPAFARSKEEEEASARAAREQLFDRELAALSGMPPTQRPVDRLLWLDGALPEGDPRRTELKRIVEETGRAHSEALARRRDEARAMVEAGFWLDAAHQPTGGDPAAAQRRLEEAAAAAPAGGAGRYLAETLLAELRARKGDVGGGPPRPLTAGTLKIANVTHESPIPPDCLVVRSLPAPMRTLGVDLAVDVHVTSCRVVRTPIASTGIERVAVGSIPDCYPQADPRCLLWEDRPIERERSERVLEADVTLRFGAADVETRRVEVRAVEGRAGALSPVGPAEAAARAIEELPVDRIHRRSLAEADRARGTDAERAREHYAAAALAGARLGADRVDWLAASFGMAPGSPNLPRFLREAR